MNIKAPDKYLLRLRPAPKAQTLKPQCCSNPSVRKASQKLGLDSSPGQMRAPRRTERPGLRGPEGPGDPAPT